MTRTHSARRPMSGFTLIELLVVTLILSILMAVAIPLYLSSVADARTKTCQANMQTIANAVQAIHVRNTDPDYSKEIGQPINNTNEPDLQNTPICPNGGVYSIVAATTTSGQQSFTVNCTKDGSFTPGVGTSGAPGGNNGAGAAPGGGGGG